MKNLLNRSQTMAAAPSRPATPDSWHDLKRDWQRWSRAERIAAECFLGAMLLGGALALVVQTLP